MKLTGVRERARESVSRTIAIGLKWREIDVAKVVSIAVYEDYCVDPRNAPEVDTRAVLIRLESGGGLAVPDEDGRLYDELSRELG